MIFKLNPAAGQPIYLQLVQQIRHATEVGILSDGTALPSIRALAEDLVVSPNTVVKAYSELERLGVLELRHGSGAYVIVKRRMKSRAEQTVSARLRVQKLIEDLRSEGFSNEEIHRLFDASLLYEPLVAKKS